VDVATWYLSSPWLGFPPMYMRMHCSPLSPDRQLSPGLLSFPYKYDRFT
jgi:hypothetical protein